jgi:hypothetical protein
MSTLPLTESFGAYLTDERHFSPYTARCYGADLRQFIEYLCDEAGVEIDRAQEELAFKQRTGTPGVVGSTGRHTITQTICEADADLIRAYLAPASASRTTRPPPWPARSPRCGPSTSGPTAQSSRPRPTP